MPVVERDPWRMQYFEGVDCPEGVVVPTDDPDCYVLFPNHRGIYNKLFICKSQGIDHAPHGVDPPRFPVFSKPIYNLRGMGTGTGILRSLEEYRARQAPGHMWMELLTGEHVSSDVAVVDGHTVWWRHTVGNSLPDGMFDYWTILAEARPEIERYCSEWTARHLAGYTGMLNFETIGGRIIEGHLRFADQWPDLYGEGWVDAVIRLYAEGRWDFEDRDRRDGFSVVLFGGHGIAYQRPQEALVNQLRSRPGISSIQITFYEDRDPAAHAMPPGGFRVAIVNGWDLAAQTAVRDELALHFWSTHELGKGLRSTG